MRPIAYQKLAIRSDMAISLEVPDGAQAAYVALLADLTAVDPAVACRFANVADMEPSATEGMPLGDLGAFEIRGRANLFRFRIIGIEDGKEHQLNVEYYG